MNKHGYINKLADITNQTQLKKIITSKFRFAFWFEIFISFGLIITLIALIFYSVLINTALLTDYYFISFGILLIFFVFGLFKYQTFHDLKIIKVDEEGIRIKYLLKKEEEFVSYARVQGFKKFRYPISTKAGTIAYTNVLEISLDNNEMIELNASYYSNFGLLKSRIYKYYKESKRSVEN
jgi:hypothetical protein